MTDSDMTRDNYEDIVKAWKTKFLDLYMSGNVEKFSQALDLVSNCRILPLLLQFPKNGNS